MPWSQLLATLLVPLEDIFPLRERERPISFLPQLCKCSNYYKYCRYSARSDRVYSKLIRLRNFKFFVTTFQQYMQQLCWALCEAVSSYMRIQFTRCCYRKHNLPEYEPACVTQYQWHLQGGNIRSLEGRAPSAGPVGRPLQRVIYEGQSLYIHMYIHIVVNKAFKS